MIITHATRTPTFITPEGNAMTHVEVIPGEDRQARLIGPRGGVSSSYEMPTAEDAPRPKVLVQTGAGSFGGGRNKKQMLADADGPGIIVVDRKEHYELYTAKC